MLNNVLNLAENIESEIINIRRDLHEIPEISYDLPKTSQYVLDKLKEFGITNIKSNICGHGIIADIDGDNGKKMIALRADMDGLPVEEQNTVDYKSVHEGKMHACGHDGHTAMLLGAAKILNENKDKLNGKVRLIFQPAEEGPPPGGASCLINEGVLDGVDAIYGIHISPNEKTGTIAFNTSTAMSALDCFTIKLTGKGGHGSMPHKSIDAIALSTQVLNNLQYVVSRQSDPLEPLVITIGTINGGTLWNIIAETVVITGTMRSYDQETRKKALKDIENVIKSSCDNVGATYSFVNEPAVNPLINHPSASNLLKEALSETIGKDNVIIMPKPSTASEDFSNYLFKVPGTFMWLGCSSGEQTSYPLHHPKFQMDESALKYGVAAHLSIVNKYLNTAAELSFDL